MSKRVILLVLTSVVITLLVSAAALAWTPQEIYDDFVANGKLTRDYSDAELQAYLNDASGAEYMDSSVKGQLDTIVHGLIDRSEFPFTGFQMLIAGIVVVCLVGGGVGLRVLTKPRRAREDA